MIRFEPALCSVTFRQLEPARIVALAQDAGLAAIEWAGDAHVPPGALAEAEEVGRMTRDAGLGLSYGSYLAPPSDTHEATDLALDTAERLGVNNIRIWPGTRGRDSATYSADERRVAAQMIQGMADKAASRGITISLENHPGSLTDETGSALDLIEMIGHENVFLYWQPRPGLPLEQALEEIARVGHHVSHLHVFAWDANRNRFPLKTAADYWQQVIEALPAGRWTGKRWAMLEFVQGDDPAAMTRDAATLKQILG